MAGHTPGDGRPTTGRPGVSIGAVVEALSAEFPDLTISKVRFLEGKGLISPARTRHGSGYRMFSPADVERLRYILTAQRDRFWPLEVIRDALDAMDRGLTTADEAPAARPQAPTLAPLSGLPTGDDLVAEPAPLRLTERELREAAQLDRDTVAGLVQFGLIKADPSGHYDANDLRVAGAAGRLAAYGLEARHLRPFRTAADREVGLVQQVVAGRRGDDDEQDPAGTVLAICLELHTALVRAALHQDR